MAKRSSDKHTPAKQKHTPRKKKFLQRENRLFLRLKNLTRALKQHARTFNSQHIHLHKSFKRSYREDYLRPTETPGLLSHAMLSFKTIFKQWRVFLPFILLMIMLYAVVVGLMSEEVYREIGDAIGGDETAFADEVDNTKIATGKIGNFAKAGLILFSTFTTGGFDTGMDESGMVFMIVLFLIMWLITIFLLRHIFAGESPKLRDGLYNSLGPLLSTLVIFAIIFVQILPLMLVAITYSAAVTTGFLATPFYALVYFIFSALMALLSGYLLSSSLMALVAVTAPGMYPLRAMFAASDLAAGRRIRIILRVLYLLFVVAFIYVVTMLPIILLDMWLKSFLTWLAGWPIVSFFLVACTCFIFIYATAYIYIYYRWLLEGDKNEQA